MFKNFLTRIIVTTLVVLALPFCATADGVTITVSYNIETNTVTLYGNADTNVVITIAHKELSPEMMSVENLPDVVKAVEATGGKFSCEIGLPSSMQSGKQIVYATTTDSEATTSFIYVNKEAADLVIQRINSSDTAQARAALLAENDTILGIDPEEAVYSANKSKFAQLLLTKNYTDSVEFLSAYNNLYPLIALKGASGSEVDKILEKDSVSLGIDYDEDITNDERLTDAVTAKLYELIADEDFAKDFGAEGFSFAKRFEELKALAALQTAENWITVKNVITQKFANLFESMLDNDTYALIGDTDMVYSEMMNYSFSSFAATVKAIEDAVDTVYKAENPPRNESQGGIQNSVGGGGGVSGKPYTTPPEIELYEETETYGDVFSDVPKSHWANKAVNLLNEKNVISGYPDGTFLPSNLITRAEFTKLTAIFASGLEKGDLINFSDVNESDWFYTYVSDASAYGVVSGIGDGIFEPYANIKREDAALIVYRLLDALGKAPIGSKVFSDRSEISGYARSAISALGSSGIVSGTGNGSFKPKDFITRAEAAQLLYNAFVK